MGAMVTVIGLFGRTKTYIILSFSKRSILNRLIARRAITNTNMHININKNMKRIENFCENMNKTKKVVQITIDVNWKKTKFSLYVLINEKVSQGVTK